MEMKNEINGILYFRLNNISAIKMHICSDIYEI